MKFLWLNMCVTISTTEQCDSFNDATEGYSYTRVGQLKSIIVYTWLQSSTPFNTHNNFNQHIVM